MKRSSVVLAILFVFFCLFYANSVSAATVLKLQSVYPENSGVGDSLRFFADKVKDYSKGEVEVQLFWPGKLVKTKEAFQGLKMGLIDAYGGSMLYFAGTVPEVNGEWMPFSFKSPAEAIKLYQEYGYFDVMRQATAKHGVRYIAPVFVGTMGFLTKFPINGLDDLKGKKIRAVGLEAHIVTALGGAPMGLSGTEQFVALQKGTVDGTDYPWYTIEDYKFYEIIKYVSSPALHTPGIVEILVSDKAYKGLSPANQAAIDQAGMDTMNKSAENSATKDARAIEFCKEKGVSIVTLNDGALAAFKKATAPLYEEHAKKSDLCAKQMQILDKFLKENK